jgi:hypothetical protein
MIYRTIFLLIFIMIICLFASLLPLMRQSQQKKEIFKNVGNGKWNFESDGSVGDSTDFAYKLSGPGPANANMNTGMDMNGDCNCCKCGWMSCAECTKNIGKCCGGNFSYDRVSF